MTNYEMISRLIERGLQDRETIAHRMDTLYLRGRLTDDEYNGLMDLLDTKYPVEAEGGESGATA